LAATLRNPAGLTLRQAGEEHHRHQHDGYYRIQPHHPAPEMHCFKSTALPFPRLQNWCGSTQAPAATTKATAEPTPAKAVAQSAALLLQSGKTGLAILSELLERAAIHRLAEAPPLLRCAELSAAGRTLSRPAPLLAGTELVAL